MEKVNQKERGLQDIGSDTIPNRKLRRYLTISLKEHLICQVFLM